MPLLIWRMRILDPDMLEFVVLLGTIISSAGLGYWLAGKFSSLEMRVSKLEQDLSSLKQDLSAI
jgi:hypothetical protein